VIYF